MLKHVSCGYHMEGRSSFEMGMYLFQRWCLDTLSRLR
ncbi:hypothetical protein ACHAXN_000415 [Cyclotella atomus]